MGAETCRWLPLLPAHTLGALEGTEGQALAAHLAEGCPGCEAELRELSRDVEALAHTVPPVAPAPTTRDWLLARARATQPRPRLSPAALRGLVVALAVLAAVAAGWGVVAARRAAQADAQRAAALAERDALARELAELARQLAEERDGEQNAGEGR